jgi:MFS family permease
LTVGRLGALRDKRFRRLFAGQALSNFGDSALYLTLGIWAKTLTGSSAAAGGVFLALAVPTLFAPLAGHLADRVRRKTLLITVNAITALIVLSLIFVRSRDELWLIYTVAFCYGASFDLLSAAGAGLRKDILRGEDLASANAALQMASQGLRVLSPLAGAGLFVVFGGPSVAIFDAITFLAAILATASLRVTESEPDKTHGSFWRDTTEGFRHIRAVPLLTQLSLVSAIAFSVIGVSETVIYAVVGQGLHRPPSFMGVVMSVQGGGSIASALTAAYLMRRAGAARTVGLALGCFALAAVFCTTGSLPVVLAGAILDGTGVVWLTVGLATAMQKHTPPRLQGRVSAAATTLLITPQTLSIAAGAALISVVSYRLLLLVMAVIIGACAAWLLTRPAAPPDKVTDAAPWRSPRGRGLRRRPGEPVPDAAQEITPAS